MIPLAFLLAAFAVTWMSEFLALCLGAWEPLFPASGVAITIAVARWAERPWHRLTACLLGAGQGIAVAGGLVPWMLGLVVVASLVRTSRAIWSRQERWGALALGAGGIAATEGLVFLMLGGEPASGARPSQFWIHATGWLSTGALTLGIEDAFARAPRLRRLLERT